MNKFDTSVCDWLEGRMPTRQRAVFERRLQSDAALRLALANAVAFDLAITDALGDRVHQNASRSPGRQRKSFTSIMVISAIAAALLLAVGLSLNLMLRDAPPTESHKQLAAQGSTTLPDGRQMQAFAPTRWRWQAGTLHLDSGGVRLHHDTQSDTAIQIQTPSGTLTPTGTTFTVLTTPHSTLMNVQSGAVRAQQGAVVQTAGPGQSIIMQASRPEHVGRLRFWHHPNSEATLSCIGTQGVVDGWPTLQSKKMQTQSNRRDNWHPKQQLVLWQADGRVLAQPGAGRIHLRLRAQQAGTITVSVGIHQARIKDEHHYWTIDLAAGWQERYLQLVDATAGPEARPLHSHAIGSLALFSLDAGTLDLAWVAIENEE